MPDTIIQLRGEELRLLPDKAIWWAARKTLLVADVHLGKVETFQHHGMALPSGSTQHDLNRLTRLLQTYEAERLVVLGDWIHAREAHNPFVQQQVQQWRDIHSGLRILLVRGNHDQRAGTLPDAWHMETASPPYEEPPFVFTHYPQSHDNGYVLCGHLHPAVQLEGQGKQRLKHPCFWVRPDTMVLPAFGSFTGTQVIIPEPEDQLYLPAAQTVIKLR